MRLFGTLTTNPQSRGVLRRRLLGPFKSSNMKGKNLLYDAVSIFALLQKSRKFITLLLWIFAPKICIIFPFLKFIETILDTISICIFILKIHWFSSFHRTKKIRFVNKNFGISAKKCQNLIVESFSEIVCFKVKFAKSIWNFHWSKILLQRHGFLAIFPLDLTNTTSTGWNQNSTYYSLSYILIIIVTQIPK